MTFFYSTFYGIATNTLIKLKILISIGFKFYTGMHSFFIIIFSYYLSYFSLTSKRINKNFSHKYLNSWIPHYKLIDRLTQFIILNFCTHLLSSWIHLEIDRQINPIHNIKLLYSSIIFYNNWFKFSSHTHTFIS